MATGKFEPLFYVLDVFFFWQTRTLFDYERQVNIANVEVAKTK